MAAETSILPALREHAEELALNLRPEDLEEISLSGFGDPLEAILSSIEVSALAYALLIDDEVVAIAGVAPRRTDHSVGVVWCLKGLGIHRHPLTFVRLCRPAIAHFLGHYPTLTNIVDAKYSAALRWARWMGFTVDEARPFGPAGRPHHRIHIRRSAHVHTD